MEVDETSGRKIYNLSGGKSLPEWADSTNRRRRTGGLRAGRLELIQDFEFPTACQTLAMSSDGNSIVAGGTYRPHYKIYDLSQLSVRYERFVDCDIVKLLVLSSDVSKIVTMHSDRSMEFHVVSGRHYRTRIPKCGRDMAYERSLCDLYAVGASSHAYRLNLEQGRFLPSLETSMRGGINCVSVADAHRLLAFGGDDGTVECWDPRAPESRGAVGKLAVGASLVRSQRTLDAAPEVSALQFDSGNGLQMAVGTSSGHVALYDLRAAEPLLVKDHRYDLPIVDIKFHGSTENMVTSDRKIVKIWNRHSGDMFANIEPPAPINCVCLPDAESGLLFIGAEQPRILTYYVPDLGLAPSFCSFLDGVTEELEEEKKTPTVYDDYKFLTREQVASLGIEKLIGTSVLRAYMHGFFIDMRLYNKVNAVADPFAYERYRKERVQQRIKERAENRIALRKSLRPSKSATSTADDAKAAAVAAMAARVAQDQQQGGADTRFAAMLGNDPDFAADSDDEEYRRIAQRPIAIASDLFDADQSSDDDDDAADAAAAQKTKIRSFALKRGIDNPLEIGPNEEFAQRAQTRRAKHRHTEQHALLSDRVELAQQERAEEQAYAGHGNMQLSFTPQDSIERAAERKSTQERIDEHYKSRKRRSATHLLPRQQNNKRVHR
jgi:ribosome biogenesis protein ENP2